MSKSQSDEDSYTEYEEIYKRIKDENESYLTMFEKYLENQGLKAQTIRRHVFNADVLINAFLLDHELCRMEEGIIIIDSFMHFFMRSQLLFQKINANLLFFQHFYGKSLRQTVDLPPKYAQNMYKGANYKPQDTCQKIQYFPQDKRHILHQKLPHKFPVQIHTGDRAQNRKPPERPVAFIIHQ